MSVDRPALLDSLEESRRDVGPLEINYAVGPDNGPTMVLIHGLGGMMHNFFNVYELLQPRWRVVLAELRGHGRSSHDPAARYTFNDYHDDMIALLRDVAGDGAIVWGHSLGAITTMNIAAEAPGLVRAAILEDPPMMITGEASHSPFTERFKALQNLMIGTLSDGEIVAELERMAPGFGNAHYRTQLAQLRLNDPAIYDPAINGRNANSWKPEKVLERIEAPTLLMQADPAQGAALRDEHAARAMAILRDATHIKYATNHGIHAALPERTVADAEAFVARRAPL